MKKIKTYAVSAAALGALFLIGSVMRSRYSQAKAATYSTPVTVMNTSSAPAIGSAIDDPGRIPYSSLQQAFLAAPVSSQFFTFPPVTANHRLVITQVTGALSTAAANATVLVELLAQGGPFGATFTAPPSAFGVNSFSTPVLYYFDAGQTPVVNAITSPATQFTTGQSLRLTGYLVDCAAAPCSPIAQ